MYEIHPHGMNSQDTLPVDGDSKDKSHHVTHSEHAGPGKAPGAVEDSLLTTPALIQEMTPEERHHVEQKLIRKIDWRLLPMCVLMYIMNYLDRNNIASARIAGKKGLQDGLGLSDTQYEVWHLFQFSLKFFPLDSHPN